ncbi:AAA family ATPase [Candidatus Dojkabacteria bacterium]|nr:AAA family ATPase [Candidatus Dojkabacteria bacterium]
MNKQIDLITTLNSSQQKAIKTIEGPVMINAGPGTGKTLTLINRILYMIFEKNISPETILVLTFTEKAAQEIKDRLNNYKADLPQIPFVGTFHALGYKILNKKYKDIKLIDEKQRKKNIRECMKSESIESPLRELDTKELGLIISKYKNFSIKSSDYKNQSHIKKFTKKYDKLLKKQNLLDFDDLLLKTYKFIKDNPKLSPTYQYKFDYILIDEFQDINPIQFKIIKLLLNKENNIFIIGDPLQSIYSFRGSYPNIFKLFKNEFPQTRDITLDINYRSTPEIIEISHNLFPKTLKLKNNLQEHGKVEVVKTQNEYTESDFILKEIDKKIGGIGMLESSEVWEHQDKKINFSDFAVMYRLHYLNIPLKKKFKDSGIPYQVIGAGSIYNQPAISFIISCLKFLNKQDNESFREIIESTFIKLSEQIKNKIFHTPDYEFYPRAKEILNQKELNNTQHRSLEKNISNINKLINSEKLKLTEVVSLVIELFNLEKYFNENTQKKQMLNEFKSIILRFDRFENGIEKFLVYLRNIEQNDFYDNNVDKVTLLTMHAAKGLEFKYVFICGFEEELIPYMKKDSDINEEKRLFYIALTRAKNSAWILYTKRRNKTESKISPFFELIKSKNLIHKTDKALESLKTKQEKLKQKKSQIKLF